MGVGMTWQMLIEAWPVFLAAAVAVFLYKVIPDSWPSPK